MTPSKSQPKRLSQVGSPEEQHLLLSALSDAPSARLQSALLAQLGLEVPPGGELPSQTHHAPVPASVGPGAVPVATPATTPFTSWIAWVGIAAVAVGVGYGVGSLSRGHTERTTAGAALRATPGDLSQFKKPGLSRDLSKDLSRDLTTNRVNPRTSEEGASLLAQEQDRAFAMPPSRAHQDPPGALPGSAVLPEAAATLPLPPPVAPALRTKPTTAPVASANLEITLVDAARAALRAGDPATCVAKLLERKRKVRGGMLEPEASLLLVQAMLAQGQTAQARAAGERFLNAEPTGPIADRMRYALAQARP